MSTSSRKAFGSLTDVIVVALDSVEAVDLPGGSWSRILIDANLSPTSGTTFGYSVFQPGTATDHMSHVVEELAYVVSGSGFLQLPDRRVAVGAKQACHIPAGIWHAVVNDSADDPLAMVFAFASPTYPATERRAYEDGSQP